MNVKIFYFLSILLIYLSTQNFVYGICQAKAIFKQRIWSAPKIQMGCNEGKLATGAIMSDKIVHAKCDCENKKITICEAKAIPGWFWRTTCECVGGILNDFYSKKRGTCVCDCI